MKLNKMTLEEYKIEKDKILKNLEKDQRELKNKHLHEEIDRVRKKIKGLHELKKWGRGKYGKHFTPEMIDKDIIKHRFLLGILHTRINKTELSPKIKNIEWNF